MTFISYAQNFEDVMLWRALNNVSNGFYIDVGACDPNQDSVTKAFYEKGWSGINIEPVTDYFNKLIDERPLDINLQCLILDESKEVSFYELPNTGLSTIDKTIAEKHELQLGISKINYKVQAKTLTEICETYNVKTVHFLKIDAEESEKQVLLGMNFSKIRPWLILVESTIPNTQIENYLEWENLLLEAQYSFVYFDGLNRFYVANEHYHLSLKFKSPPNCFDRFVLTEQHDCCHNIASEKAFLKSVNTEQKITLAKHDFLIKSLNQELKVIYNSASWRMTKPLRILKRYVNNSLKYITDIFQNRYIQQQKLPEMETLPSEVKEIFQKIIKND